MIRSGQLDRARIESLVRGEGAEPALTHEEFFLLLRPLHRKRECTDVQDRVQAPCRTIRYYTHQHGCRSRIWTRCVFLVKANARIRKK